MYALKRFGVLAATAVAVAASGGAASAASQPGTPSTQQPGAPSSQGSSVPSLLNAIPGLSGLKLPPSLDKTLDGLPNGPLRNYGTPTKAPGKVCPFVGKIPVSLPVINSPDGTSLPGLAGVDLSQPSVSSHIYGELCMSTKSLAEAKKGNPPAVLLLVHGITYGTYYWDFPYDPQKYSTVNYLDRNGYATLNIDRLGDGRSDHPLSPLVNAPAQAVVTHELVQKLKDGQIGAIRFPHVGLVGHSYGTVIDWLESSMYNDTDTDIGSGYSDRVNPVTAGTFIGMSEPALASSVDASQPWAIDPGYLQPLPTARGLPQLYYKPNTDPQVIATDRKLANTVTAGEVATFVGREYDGTHKNIRIPTFDIQGEDDIMTCGNNADECATKATMTDGPATLEKDAARFTQWQSTAFGPQACFRAAVIPDAAHDDALQKNAGQFQAQVLFFANQAMGTHGQNVTAYRDTCAQRGPSIFDDLPELNRLVPPAPLAPPPIQQSIVDPIAGLLGLPISS